MSLPSAQRCMLLPWRATPPLRRSPRSNDTTGTWTSVRAVPSADTSVDSRAPGPSHADARPHAPPPPSSSTQHPLSQSDPSRHSSAHIVGPSRKSTQVVSPTSYPQHSSLDSHVSSGSRQPAVVQNSGFTHAPPPCTRSPQQFVAHSSSAEQPGRQYASSSSKWTHSIAPSCAPQQSPLTSQGASTSSHTQYSAGAHALPDSFNGTQHSLTQSASTEHESRHSASPPRSTHPTTPSPAQQSPCPSHGSSATPHVPPGAPSGPHRHPSC